MDDCVTKEDLRQFRILLIHEIRELLTQKPREDDDVIPAEWLRSKVIRQIMNISPGTLQNLRVQGKVRYRKVMGSYYYNKSDLSNLFK